MKKISFCIPCYKSSQSIESVINGIYEAMNIRSGEFETEIICVVDGSPDDVYEKLKNLSVTDKRIKVINFTKNFGQASARMASLYYATGDYHVCIDDDGQCPMECLWQLLDPVLNGVDVSIAKYPKKKQSWFKNFGSWVNDVMIHTLLNVPKDFCFSNYWVMHSYITEQVLKYHNPYPYLTGLISQSTDSFAYVEMEEHDRMYGSTGYTLKKLIDAWLCGALNFSVKPLHITNIIGTICSFLGFIVGVIAIIQKIAGMPINVGYTSIFAAIFFVGGIQMLMLGVIGEYVGRTFMGLNSIPQYVVRNTINTNQEDSILSEQKDEE